jgi:uncharacterized coiled-coil protein SlyX
LAKDIREPLVFDTSPGVMRIGLIRRWQADQTGQLKSNPMKILRSPITLTITKITYPTLALFALACFALAPGAQATCQEGCDLTKGSTFLGDDALISNTGFDNTAIGSGALTANTAGGYNTAIGVTALFSNTTGSINTASGRQALYYNTTGDGNTANGEAAVSSNTQGSYNTGIGTTALLNNTIGNNNTAVGYSAFFGNTTGSDNIALGHAAGANNITGSNNIYIGNPGTHTDSSRIRIGTPGTQTKAFIAGISGATVPSGVGVIVGSNGQLGTIVSSKRFKDEIKPMNKASEAILALKPVTFRYKKELDPDAIPQFGLVAEEVAKVDPDLVARDEMGKPYTVRYEAVNAMLLNEFLKEHGRVEQLKTTVSAQEKQIAMLTASLKEQGAQIQKVSAQLGVNKQSLQTVADNR